MFVVGDLCYADPTGGATPSTPLQPLDLQAWDDWLAIAAGAGSIPWVVAVGNHEMEQGQGELGYDGVRARVPLPGGGPEGVAAGVARWGNVALVALDANDVSEEITRNQGYSGGAQTAWLDTTLASLHADEGVDWIVVGFHHCAYCTNAVHASDGGVRAAWEAIFDRHEVDLVVNGHNHCYERAHPLRGGEVVEVVAAGEVWDARRGTTYLTAGGGGQTGYPTSLAPGSYVTMVGGVRVPEAAPWSATRYNDNSLVVLDAVDASGALLVVTALRRDGTEIERIHLRR